jgi:phosphatidylserine/phosphatidylglycerophosphate/cardiolipin synthase-like enzyme
MIPPRDPTGADQMWLRNNAHCLPTGPADEVETGTLLLDTINMAQSRIWIASVCFVPDAQFISALQLAELTLPG